MKLTMVLVAALAACGSETGGGDLAIGDFAQAYTDAICGALVACDAAPDTASCAAVVGVQDFALTTLLADVEAGVVKYNGSAARACLDSYADQCDVAGPHNPDPSNNPCSQMFTGTVAAGGTCFSFAECAGFADCAQTDAACDPSAACCPGTCGAPRPAPAPIGGACHGSYDCVEDAYCDHSSGGTGTCVAVATHPGDACSDFYGCANPMMCTEEGGPGTCYLAAATGGACDPQTPLGPDLACASGRDFCDATSRTCVTRVDVGGTCPSGTLCKQLASCVNGTCVLDATVGAACDATNGPSCQYSASCVDGTCAAAPVGHACR